jgi:hypothetical protein
VKFASARLISADIKALVSLYEVWASLAAGIWALNGESGGCVIAIAGNLHAGPSAICTISASPGATSSTNSKSRFGGPSGGSRAGIALKGFQPAAHIAPEGWQSGNVATC